MQDRLATYLHDHLAGSHFAIQLLNSLYDQYKDEPLGQFAAVLCAEIRGDQNTLQNIIDRVGNAHLDLTEAAGWLAEKASQFKLQHDGPGGLGTFEALEALSLGIQGKLALWRALPLVREFDARIPDQNFNQLVATAEDQFARVEEQRLQQIQVTFRAAAP